MTASLPGGYVPAPAPGWTPEATAARQAFLFAGGEPAGARAWQAAVEAAAAEARDHALAQAQEAVERDCADPSASIAIMELR